MRQQTTEGKENALVTYRNLTGEARAGKSRLDSSVRG